MDYLGLFCLGAFVGTVATSGLRRMVSLQDWKMVLGVTLPAVLSGVAMMSVDRFKYSPAFGCYPLGLVASLMWAYSAITVSNLRTGTWRIRLLAALHLTASAIVTVGAAGFAVVPAYLQLRAEWQVPQAQRVDELAVMREAARQGR